MTVHRPGPVGVLAVAAALAVAGCDDGVPDIDTAAALPAVTGWNGPTALVDCPLGDIRSILDDATADVDDPVVTAALAGDPLAGIDRPDGVDDPVLSCSLATGEAYAGVAVTAAPDDLETHAASLADPFGDRAAEVEFRRTNPYRGGVFHRVCATFPDDPAAAYCQVEWLDDRLLVTVFVGGDGAGEVDLRLVEERFGYLIEPMLERLAADDDGDGAGDGAGAGTDG